MPRFKLKVGHGKFYDYGNRLVVAGGIVERDRRELLGHAASKFDQLDPDLPDPLDAALKSVPSPLVKPRGGGWYDVVNPKTGRPINTSALRLEDAEEIARAYGPAEAGDHGDGPPSSTGPGADDEPQSATVPADPGRAGTPDEPRPSESPNPAE